MSFHERYLPHYQSDNKAHFITFCTFEKWKLPPTARDIVMECCHHEHTRKYILDACVVMPDHVHVILAPGIDHQHKETFSLSHIMKVLKGYSAYRINRELHRSGSVWQDESFDHVLRKDESLEALIDYLKQNPVRRGLVQRAEDYRWFWQNPVLRPEIRLPVKTF